MMTDEYIWDDTGAIFAKRVRRACPQPPDIIRQSRLGKIPLAASCRDALRTPFDLHPDIWACAPPSTIRRKKPSFALDVGPSLLGKPAVTGSGTMQYISTRGSAAPQDFAQILLAGLAPDGGLFMPEVWPRISPMEIASFRGRSYQDVAYAILSRFAGESFSERELRDDIEAAYADFDDPAIAPLLQLDTLEDAYLLELFHGPTLAFKDIAMQVLGRLFARALARTGNRATVLAATSGDTGSAAIAALGGLPNIDVFVMHPKDRVSEVQRLQMTTSPHANVHNIAVEGTFDDAQAIVKTLFGQRSFSRGVNLTAVNSINFARIAAQAVYYFTAAVQVGDVPTFVVPTGNFGDVFAGEAAMRMGLPVSQLVVATNENDIMARTLREGVYESADVQPTFSPSMDIQVASNFERALFEASGRDSEWIREAMLEFSGSGSLALPSGVFDDLRQRYAAHATSNEETLETIASVYENEGIVIDPHTAVAWAAAEPFAGQGPLVILSTAHPAKFPEAVACATGEEPDLPPQLKGLYEGEERYTVLPAESGSVRSFILEKLGDA